jgi:uncharacterized protein YcfL
MRNAIFSLGLILLMVGCTEHRAGRSESEQRAANEANQATAAVPASPEFGVSVRLSDAAKKKLNDSQETIIVAGDFTGHPKQGTERRYLDIKSGQVDLGRVEVEAHPDETATFNDLKLNADALGLIDARGPNILLSVFSGRKSSKDNLLDCEVYDGSLDSVHGRTIEIPCQLIGERSPRDMGIR